MKKSRFLFAMVVGSAFLLATTLFAAGRDVFPGSVHQEWKTTAKTTLAGILQCRMPSENDGSPCTVSLHDPATGKSYPIDNAATLREMYYNGIRQVKITGSRDSAGEFTVESVQSL
ncbi:MAG: hypothetical protein IT285_02355 [Bdellovibrionales bacterium]|nr:hypothetical protein [Bdellovibrionales bacterium]